MKEMCKILYNDYEKISDFIMFLNPEYILKFNVELSKKDKKKNRENFHKEFGYNLDGLYRININRNIYSYLSIESVKRNNGKKVQIRIGINEIYFFCLKIRQAASWFTSSEYKNLFVIKNGRIIIPKKIDSIKINTLFDTYVEIEPTTIMINDSEQATGVRFYLDSDNINFFMDTDTLLSFNYFLSTFNMYQSAQLMLNYIGRPEFGANYSEFENNYFSNQNNNGFFSKVQAKKC